MQVSLTYNPTGGAQVHKEVIIAVKSGPAHMPRLPAHIITDRTCFNVGPAAQRTVIPSTRLTVSDR